MEDLHLGWHSDAAGASEGQALIYNGGSAQFPHMQHKGHVGLLIITLPFIKCVVYQSVSLSFAQWTIPFHLEIHTSPKYLFWIHIISSHGMVFMNHQIVLPYSGEGYRFILPPFKCSADVQ